MTKITALRSQNTGQLNKQVVQQGQSNPQEALYQEFSRLIGDIGREFLSQTDSVLQVIMTAASTEPEIVKQVAKDTKGNQVSSNKDSETDPVQIKTAEASNSDNQSNSIQKAETAKTESKAEPQQTVDANKQASDATQKSAAPAEVVAQAQKKVASDAASNTAQATEQVSAQSNDTASTQTVAGNAGEQVAEELSDKNAQGLVDGQGKQGAVKKDSEQETIAQSLAQTKATKIQASDKTSDVEVMEKVLKGALANQSTQNKSDVSVSDVKAALDAVLKGAEIQARTQLTSLKGLMATAIKEVASNAQGIQFNINHTASMPGTIAQKSQDSSSASTTKVQAPLPKATQLRAVEAVKEALKEAAASNDGKTVSVRLDPPELGKVKIDVSFKDGVLSAKLVAESQQINSVLRDKAFEIQALLRKLGIAAEKIVVVVGSGDEQSMSLSTSSDNSEAKGQKTREDNSFEGLFPSMDEGNLVKTGNLSNVLSDHWIA